MRKSRALREFSISTIILLALIVINPPIVANNGQIAVITYDNTGNLLKGAEVYLDGELVDKIPQEGYITFDVEPGEHLLEVKKGGYQPEEKKVEIEEDKLEQVRVELQEEVVNEEPVAHFSFSPQKPKAGETVTFDASESYDPDGKIVRYEWDFDGDGNIDKTGEQTTYKFKSSGEKSITLKVEDNKEAKNSTVGSISIKEPNKPPSASIRVMPSKPKVGDEVSFYASGSSDPDGEIEDYKWHINGTKKEGFRSEHTFSSPGEHKVELEVVDDSGLTDSVVETIEVTRKRGTKEYPIRVPEDYSSLEVAIKSAPDGGYIIVDNGNFEVGSSIEKSLNIKGESPDDTTITANSDSKFAFEVSEGKLTLMDLTISEGGGGVELTRADLELVNCKVVNMKGEPGIGIRDSSGGINVFGGKVLIENSNLSDNIVGIFIPNAKVKIFNSLIANNEFNGVFVGLPAGTLEGIKLIEETELVIRNSEILNNGDWGGISLLSNASASIRKNTISDNEGCGICLYGDARAKIVFNKIKGNKSGVWGATRSWARKHDNISHYVGVLTGLGNDFEDNSVGAVVGRISRDLD